MLHKDITCSQQDGTVFNKARHYTAIHQIPALLTEFGATDNLANLAGVLRRADDDRMGWCWLRPTRNWLRARRSSGRSSRAHSGCATRPNGADHQGRFSPDAQTVVSVPPIEYSSGYQVTVKGRQVVSAPGAPLLTVAADAGADTVDVTVTP